MSRLFFLFYGVADYVDHRVDRELGFFSSRPANCDLPTPSPAGE